MRRARLPWAAMAAISCALVSVNAGAQEPDLEPAPPQIWIDAQPTVRVTSDQVFAGWTEITVQIHNSSPSPVRGEVLVGRRQSYGSDTGFRAHAPYDVPPGGRVLLAMPVRAEMYQDVTVRVHAEDHEKPFFERRFGTTMPLAGVLLDGLESSQLHRAIGDLPIDVVSRAAISASRGGTAPTVVVATPTIDGATGDTVLPTRAAGYGGVAVVLLDTTRLTHLDAAELDALASWVVGGGSLALVVTRPEDLRSAALTSMLGGPAKVTKVPRQVYAELVLSAHRASRPMPYRAAPSDDVGPTLIGYEGGNLRGSLYGSSAPYGLGEVHLLAFDPAKPTVSSDPWVQARLLDMIRLGLDRQSVRVGANTPSYYQMASIRRQLDPNEGSRWAIGAAAILLCIYAVIAGPVSFMRASRKGKPLQALLSLPVFALLAFVFVVGIGMAAKGVRGRSRRLTFVDMAAGAESGAARRYRGFYTAESENLAVAATDARAVLSVGLAGDHDEPETRVAVQRDGLHLEGMATLPWQTLVVSEEGIASVGEGIAILQESSDVLVVNHTGHGLRGVVLSSPGQDPVYFGRIEPGQRVKMSEGRVLDDTPSEQDFSSEVRSSRGAVTRLATYYLGGTLDRDAPGLAEAWSAIVDTSDDNADWFVDDVPTLLAQVDDGDGASDDSGLPIESSRLLVRVVGYGGTP